MKIEKFNEFFNDIKEGLIETYPIKTSVKLISRELSLNKIIYNIDFDESTNTIFIKSISDNLNNYDIISLFRSVNLCGYFISNYDFYDVNDNNIDYLIQKDPIDSDFIETLSEKIKNSYYTQITIESKYNSKVEIPNYLYHVTAKG